MIGKNDQRRYRQLRFSLAIVFAVVSLSSRAGAELGGKPEKSSFTISYTQASGAFTPLWVAQEAGLFKKHGLDAGLKLFNSQVALQALVAGDVEVQLSRKDFFIISAFTGTGRVPGYSILGLGLLFWGIYSALVFGVLWLVAKMKKPNAKLSNSAGDWRRSIDD